MEEKQVIIAISREFGSGGHFIAEKIAERLALPLYDKNLLSEIAAVKKLNAKGLEKYDETPRNKLLSRTVKRYSNSPEENIAKMQFDYLKKKAESGKSFVIVGRCAETVLKDYDCLISFFILGDKEKKIERIAKINHFSENEAKNLIRYQDKKRKTYHNHYCEIKWGDSRNYDLSINSSGLGIDETVEVLLDYIIRKLGQN